MSRNYKFHNPEGAYFVSFAPKPQGRVVRCFYTKRVQKHLTKQFGLLPKTTAARYICDSMITDDTKKEKTTLRGQGLPSVSSQARLQIRASYGDIKVNGIKLRGKARDH